MLPFFGPRFGNPSSTHRWGREARTALDAARERVAKCLGANADEVCFTSCGTEGDNLADARRHGACSGPRGATRSSPRRSSTRPCCGPCIRPRGRRRRADARRRRRPATVSWIRTRADPRRHGLCSVMWVNNEIGTIQPIPELGAARESRGAVFHTDAVQAFGKVDIDAAQVRSISSRSPATRSARRRGSARCTSAAAHRSSRSSTAVPGARPPAGHRKRRATPSDSPRPPSWRWRSTRRGRARHRAARAARGGDSREAPRRHRHRGAAPSVRRTSLNISVPGTDSESMLMALDLQGIACSAGSACQSGSVGAVARADRARRAARVANAAIRMSLGSLTTDAAIDRVAEVFPRSCAKARGMASVA